MLLGKEGGKLFFWDGSFRRIPQDWAFPNKMTLRTAWHRYFLVDHQSGVCQLRHLTAKDLVNQKNGRRNISNLKNLMKYMINICKAKNLYFDNPTEKQVSTMYSNAASQVLKLSNNRRCEAFSWHTHVRNITKESKRIKSSST